MSNRSGAVSQMAVGIQGDAASSYSNFTTEAEATDRILLSSGNPKKTAEMIQEDALVGEIGRGTPDRGLETSEDSIECYVPFTYKDTDFISADSLIASFMGDNTFGDTDYNICQISDSSIYALTLAYVFGTPANGQLRVATGAIPTSMELSCELSGKLTANFDFACWDVGDSDGTNSVGEGTGVDAIPHIGHTNSLGHYMTFRISDADSVLSSSDQITISSFTLSANKNFDTETYGTPDSSNHTNAQKILLPIVDGKREATIDLEIPQYENQTFMDWNDNSTQLHADIKITDGTDEINIYMPNITLDDVDTPMDSPSRLTQSVSGILARRDDTVLSDGNMTFSDQVSTSDVNVDKEFGIEFKNDRTAAIL